MTGGYSVYNALSSPLCSPPLKNSLCYKYSKNSRGHDLSEEKSVGLCIGHSKANEDIDWAAKLIYRCERSEPGRAKRQANTYVLASRRLSASRNAPPDCEGASPEASLETEKLRVFLHLYKIEDLEYLLKAD